MPLLHGVHILILRLSHLCCPGVISLQAMGIRVGEEAMQEATAASAQATQLLDMLLPALLSAFRLVLLAWCMHTAVHLQL